MPAVEIQSTRPGPNGDWSLHASTGDCSRLDGDSFHPVWTLWGRRVHAESPSGAMLRGVKPEGCISPAWSAVHGRLRRGIGPRGVG